MSKFHIVINYSLIPIDLRISNLFVSIIRYLWNMVWPVELSIFTPFPKTIPLWHFLLSLLFVLFITAVSIRHQKKTPLVHRGLALVSHGPVARRRLDSSRALAGDGKPVHVHPDDRPVYPPCVGMRHTDQGALLATHESPICASPPSSTLLSLTRVQNIYYSNSYALFTRANEITGDNFVACNNIGDALASLNRTEEAGRYFEKAIALNPKYDDAIYNYALYLAKKGDPLDAAAHFSRVIKINPHYTRCLCQSCHHSIP